MVYSVTDALPTSNSLLTEGSYDYTRKFLSSVYGQ